MCLMAFALHTHPKLGLLLAANRDEALERPTQPLHHWSTAAGTPVWAGRDVREGGTWIGCTLGGRVGLLTNVRDPALAGPQATDAQLAQGNPFPRSRGELVTRWLDTAAHTPDAHRATQSFVDWLGPIALAFGGFNLVLGDVTQAHWVWLNNRPQRVWSGLPQALQAITQRTHTDLLVAPLPPGVYGMSNAGLNTPWPKTVALTQALGQHLAATPTSAPQPPTAGSPLWAALANRHTYPDDQLPQTGVAHAWERALSAAWVDVETSASRYGTRSGLLMQLQRHNTHNTQWQAHMLEQTWRPQAQAGWVNASWAF